MNGYNGILFHINNFMVEKIIHVKQSKPWSYFPCKGRFHKYVRPLYGGIKKQNLISPQCTEMTVSVAKSVASVLTSTNNTIISIS